MRARGSVWCYILFNLSVNEGSNSETSCSDQRSVAEGRPTRGAWDTGPPGIELRASAVWPRKTDLRIHLILYQHDDGDMLGWSRRVLASRADCCGLLAVSLSCREVIGVIGVIANLPRRVFPDNILNLYENFSILLFCYNFRRIV